ncbi:MAG: SpoIID/LytB domain-containing protein [Candidatus Omnitrophica bacterium]|nr:SpoIID/LytB domain-containing protein [Candidatus Omnitrophota bacterium]MCB9721312.1 SpoIID/LytB domain-containing protein [Candidatus Omnitrophota bacterium]
MRLLRLLLSVCLAVAVALPAAADDDPVIRVAILQAEGDFVISARGVYTVTDQKSGMLLVEGRRLRRSRVQAVDGGLAIGSRFFDSRHLRVSSQKDVTIYAHNKQGQFRGSIDVIAGKDGKLLVINRLDLESYVKGVLLHEVSDRWPIEATKAQAVATRTYALYKAAENKAQPFDVTSDIYSQVYGGKTAERFRTDIAAEYTKGQVMVFEGKIIPAFFHANSGGHTEDANIVWGIDLPPLKGVEDPYSKDMPAYTWKKNFQSREIQEKLQAAGIKVGMIKDIEVTNRTPSGRIQELVIRSRDGKTTRLTGKKFRDIIGPNLVRSNMYEVDMQGFYFDLTGKGWGHGVGLCQWGAYQMARQRHDYDEILRYYYPGIEIKKVKAD